MKLSEQVVSLDLSKRLKELGFEQESIFIYTVSGFNCWLSLVDEERDKMWSRDLFENLMTTADCKQTYNAYTVAELGEMLPSSYTFEDTTCHITIEKDLNWWTIKYNSKTSNWCEEKNITEADARAKMLIYLKDNNLI